VLLALQVREVHKVIKVVMAQQAHKGLEVHKVIQARRVMVILHQLAQQAQLVIRELPVTKAQQVL
jgi:hypothetical protein